MRPRIVLVAAVARNGVIGSQGGLAWHVPEDLAHFKAVTAGCPVIMGRSTWLSIPSRFRPLPGRRNLVLSRQPGFEASGAEVAATLEVALERASAAPPGMDAPTAICIIGGSQVYAAALPWADRLELTEIQRDFDGDARFPAWPKDQFLESTRQRVHARPPNDFDLDFVRYDRHERRAHPPWPHASSVQG